MGFLPNSLKGKILLISGISLIIIGTIIWGYVISIGTVNGVFDDYSPKNKQGSVIASVFQLAGTIPIIILFIRAEKFYGRKSNNKTYPKDFEQPNGKVEKQ